MEPSGVISDKDELQKYNTDWMNKFQGNVRILELSILFPEFISFASKDNGAGFKYSQVLQQTEVSIVSWNIQYLV